MNRDALKSWARSFIPRPLYNTAVKFRDNVEIYSAKLSLTGKNVYVHKGSQILGWKSFKIGSNSVISDDCWINVNSRKASKIQIIIGNNVFIGRNNLFNSGKSIIIGDYVLTGSGCHFISSDHVFSDPFKPYASTGTTLTKTLIVGANCWFGANVTVLGEVTVGHGSILGANSFINKDIPPFSIVVGNPSRVIKRFDLNIKKWIPIAKFTEEMERMLPDEENYLEILRRVAPILTQPRKSAGASEGDLP